MQRCRVSFVLCPSLLLTAAAFAQTNTGFVATKSISVGGTPSASAVADFNHDGIPDVAVADGLIVTGTSASGYQYTNGGVSVVLGAGNGNFHPVVHYPTIGVAQFVCAADVNGDGNPDLIVASFVNDTSTPVGQVEVLINKGNGTFAAPVVYTIPGAYPRAIYPGDFNGDGHIDLAVAVTTTATNISEGLAIYMNKGDGTFRLGQQSTNLYPFGTADFNRDGKLDLIVGNFTGQFSHSVSVLFGAGNGTFPRSGPVFTLASPISIVDVAIADFNEDGYPDVAVANGGATVLLGSADGTLRQAPRSPTLDNGVSVVAGDFNHDGHVDLAFLTGFEQTEVDVLLGHGDGTFAYRTIYGSDGANGYGPGGIRAADLNKDGYLDLVTINSSGTVSPIYGKPGGTFNAETNTPPGWNNAVSTATGDFNGDGVPDVAVLYASGIDKPRATVSIYAGRRDGQFKPLVTHYQTATTGTALAAGDINRDGKLDLILFGQSASIGSTYGLLLGKGDGTFAPVRSLNLQPTSCCGDQIFLADVNNDHKLDIVSSDGVSLGNGDGTFRPFVPFATGFIFATHFTLGDFNGDGNLDLAFISDDDLAVITIYPGDGKGNFSSTPSFSATLPYGDPFHTYIAVGHFTPNGALGIVAGTAEQDSSAGQFSYGAISLLAGKGDGTLSQPVTYQLAQDLEAFGIADFNGDGLDDVAVLNSGSSDTTGQGNYSLVSLFTSAGDGTLRARNDFGAGGLGVFAFRPNLSIADFNGDGAKDIASVDGAGVGLLLNSAGTMVELTTSPNPAAVGQAVTLHAQVTPSFRFSGSVGAGGSVTFYDGLHPLGTSGIVNGIAALTLSGLSPGSHKVTAVYSGNTSFAPHRSNAVTEVVHR
jgi:hypothetical protein